MSAHPQPAPACAALHTLAAVTSFAIALGGSLAALGGCSDAPRPPPPETPDEVPEVRELGIYTTPRESVAPSLFGGSGASLRDVLARIAAAERDEDAKGLLLRVGSLPGAWAKVSELQRALARVRAAGKPVHCHLDRSDNLGYLLLASACDRISMTPSGDIDLVGPAAHLFYARELLDRIGVHADFVHVGRYKDATATFTETSMPETTEESMGTLLDDLHAILIEGIAEGRDLDPDAVRRIIDAGPYDAGSALEAGLIDDIGFEDEARAHVKAAAAAERVRAVGLRPASEPMGVADILAALAGEPPTPPAEGERVAVAFVHGLILDSEERVGTGAASGPFVRAMKRFRDDDEIRAVVVRIDSGGGSALAGDRMWHAVRLVARKKPVIVSLGEVAASGGYYIAAAGDEIYALEGSLVGSIGAFAGKFTVEKLADDLGVGMQVMTRGENAGWTSPTRGFTPAERAVLTRRLRRTYDRFVNRVAVGRDMDPARVRAAAEGRVYTARTAARLGLIDEVGGLDDALARARERAELPEYSPVEMWPPNQTLLDVLAEAMGGAPPGDATRAQLADAAAAAGPLGEAALIAPTLLETESVALALPYIVVIR